MDQKKGLNIIKSSFFDEFPDDRKEYEFDYNKFWLSYAEFHEMETQFPHFSKNPMIEGILFKKSKKTAWFRNKFYILYLDRLVLYKGDSEYPDKVMLLRGVTMHLAEDVISSNEMELNLTIEDIEKRIFIFTRNKKYCIISAGTKEHYDRWLEEFKKCIILTNFSKYYTILRPIAKGTFAKVVECQRVNDLMTFAVKTLEKNNILNSASAVRSKIGLINEINVLRRMDHPKIIKLYEVYEGKYNIYLVMENMKGGELFNEIVKYGNFTEKQSSVILLQLLNALDYIHGKGFAHRDVKLENMIFVKEGTFEVKIADFGLSENLSKKKCLFRRCGTPGYVAPEVLNDAEYTTKCDIFSAGVVLYIMLTGYSPFFAGNFQEILVKNRLCKIDYNVSEVYGVNISFQALHLLKWMLEPNPDNRPTAKEAMNHPWFLDQMSEAEKKNHIIAQRHQTNLLKTHELKIQPKILKKSKSIDLTMQTPDCYVPFDNNNNNPRSPINTPEIMALKMKPFQKNLKKNKGEEIKENDELYVSIYDEEQACRKGSSPQIECASKPLDIQKKYFSSSDLLQKGTKYLQFQEKNERNPSEKI